MSSTRQVQHNVYKATTKDAGQGLFASKDLSSGDSIISISRPLFAVLDTPRLEEACSNCFTWVPRSAIGSRGDGKEEVVLRACTGCRVVRYCGKGTCLKWGELLVMSLGLNPPIQACQTEAWKTVHKHECKIFKHLQPKILPNSPRLVVQAILCHEKGSLSDELYNALMKLLGHLEGFRNAEPEGDTHPWERLCLIAQAAKTYSGTKLSEEMVMEIVGKTLVNTLTLVTPTYDPIGLCLDPLVSLINHSCRPNAVISFSGPRLSIRSIAPIKKDEQITISYIDCTEPFKRRQHELTSKYFFTCKCKECILKDKGDRDAFTPEPTTEEKKKDLLKEDTNARAALWKASHESSSPTEKVETLLLGTRNLQKTGCWPVSRQPYALLLQDLAVGLIEAGQWILAFINCIQIYFDIDPIHFPIPHHPVRVVHNWRFTMLALQVSNLDNKGALKEYELHWGVIIWGLLNEVASNVDRSHGAESEFAEMVKRKVEEVRVDMSRSDDNDDGGAGSLPTYTDVEREWKKLREIKAKRGFQ
ncbi:MAG: hypothetical protein M1834_007762 [Cirrosporium novae-zelandiae]|nr:MAG: hypothetical protein M1834_007762 [Cirrosporium novae-zelandiae]